MSAESLPSSSLPEDTDIYCLHCGYNLRGLSGDPRRCPECGHMNPMGTAEIPAKLITEQLRLLETAPAMCAGLSILAFVLLVILASVVVNMMTHPWEETGIGCAGVPLAVSLVGIAAAASQFRKSCRAHPRWRGALWEYWFRAVGLGLLVLGAPTLLGLLSYMGYSDAITPLPARVSWTLHAVAWLFVVIVILTMGPATHRKLKDILHPLQRDVAVQIARDILRKKLYRGGRGPYG